MTIIRQYDKKCSVCGKSSPQRMLASTNSSGYSDLDLRPPEMQRSTMGTWIQECPHCGYVARNLEGEAKISKDFLNAEEYVTCEGHDFKGRLSKLFYKCYLIARQSEDTMMCFVSLRNCAWDCDDYDDENARSVRMLALDFLDDLISRDNEDSNTFLVIKADFLRRSGEFEKLIDEYENMTIGEELLDRIIQFQIGKALEKDAACYTIGDVVGR